MRVTVPDGTALDKTDGQTDGTRTAVPRPEPEREDSAESRRESRKTQDMGGLVGVFAYMWIKVPVPSRDREGDGNTGAPSSDIASPPGQQAPSPACGEG
ncbi:hypothetical protein GCM10007301_39910 [Azorhizobium oxalatiphilum]|uniref:Uncharacterized protein n=1 Tax=Azorhizobium oxalatiphilum TaxID=980631 RepID=A0A917CAT1_9HYPH|nr:hypothetical protein GCM10007301_39910 [Azorhizobium oxalatiphilum]